jgi:hypothetical protein
MASGRNLRVLWSGSLFAAALSSSALVSAQTDPKFEFAKAEAPKPEAPPVEWKAQAKLGALITGGNSQVRSVLVGVTASRKAGPNRLSLEGGVAYGTTNVITPEVVTPTPPMTGPPLIEGLPRQNVTTTNNWLARGRYDRFFSENNAGYATGQGAGDEIAGKSFFGGGQIGYSRQLLKNEANLVVAELGYDFSYERYVQVPGKTLDPVSVHSLRVFAGETLKLSAATGINASVEALFNVNKEGKALDHNTGQPGVDPFKDTRVVGKLSLSTTVWKSLSIALGYTLRFDQNPAPRPIPGNAPAGAMYDATAFAATGGVPFSDSVDHLGEATLIYTFL